MKKELINTGVIVPIGRRYSYDPKDNSHQEFIEKMVTILKLPDNWNEYFNFNTSNDFISLTEKGFYKVTNFRRFKRGKEAIIDNELLENIKNHVEYQIKKTDKEKTELDTRNYNIELTREVVNSHNNDEWEIHYTKQGLEIKLQIPKEEMWYSSELGKIYIPHSGKITEPIFSASFPTTRMPISAARAWIDNNIPIAEKLIQKANNIKSELPEEYFIKESVTTEYKAIQTN